MKEMDFLMARMRHVSEADSNSLELLTEWHEGINKIPGFGPKATAHLMRNIGLFNFGPTDYPIIDVHILKALNAFNFKIGDYAEAEESFRGLARLVDIPIILLDAMLWLSYSDSWNKTNVDFGNFEFR